MFGAGFLIFGAHLIRKPLHTFRDALFFIRASYLIEAGPEISPVD